MKSPALSTILNIFLCLMVLLVPRLSYALEVQNIRFGTYPDKTRMVVELTESTDFRIFVLPDPYRMIIDLPAFTWKAGDMKNQKGIGITAIRHGNLKPGISRIVFDLNRPVSIHNAFTLGRDGKNPNRLVIDFANTNAAGFEMAQREILGGLDVDNLPRNKAPEPYEVASLQGMAPPTPAPKPNTQNQKPLIIIDPGHGGVDPGAIGANGVNEKDVVLALAKELKKQLEASGMYRVKMTRDTDVFIKLRDRVKYAQQNKGDLFISIHADSISDSGVNGASIYTLSEKASDAQTAKLAARENKADLIAGIELEVEDEAVVDILIDLARRNTQNQSKFLANTVVSKLNSNGLKTLTSPHRSANFAVLKAPEIPSVLVETGFMSNKAEANRLNTASHREKVAGSLKKGIDAYFKTVKENDRI